MTHAPTTDDLLTDGDGPSSAPRRGHPRLAATLVKIVSLAILDAGVVYAGFILALRDEWTILALAVAGCVLLNWIYLRRGALPAKYLAPGVVFLLIFQVYAIAYSTYIAFTNYGDGHMGAKDDAISAILAKSQTRVPDSPAYDLTVVEQFGVLGFLVTDPLGDVFLGTEDSPLEPVADAEIDGSGRAIALPGHETLDFSEMIDRQTEIAALSVPLSSDPNDGDLRTPDGSRAYLYLSSLEYDETNDTFIDGSTGTVYADDGNGSFTSAEGQSLQPGWKIDVGFENFVRAFSEPDIREPLLGVLIWTFVFAGVTVFGTFVIGLFLAIVFNDWRLRFRRTYRVFAILPYAFPAFLSALIWSGLLNSQFGFINAVLLGGADIPWLTDPILAKVSILAVNIWLGFPYMFLVATGALQSIPDELVEAARVDGARPWALFRLIKLPLLLVSMAPLLIAAFAFNFNNFNVIYMLTEGGPRDINAGMNVGATDILITLVYKIAFGDTTGRDFGLASAFSILIFILIAGISALGFRRTKALEDLH